jgi:glycosyltransferase involved in cell wall biosynthesis
MKIIQLIQKPQRRGAEIFAVQLSEVLSRMDHEVLLISLFEGTGELIFSGRIINLNRSLSHRFLDFSGWQKLSEIIQSFQPDLVQANAADTLKFSVFSKLFFKWKAPIVYRNANQMGDFIRGRGHRFFNQFLINRLVGVVSVSEASRTDLQRNFIFDLDKSVVIPIGIDTGEIVEKLKEDTLPTLPESFLIQIGGWVPEKDPLGMIGIFEKLSPELPDLQFVFMGSGPLEKEMIQRIGEIDLGQRIHLIPNQQNIFPILAKAKAMVMSSKIEGLPGVILEAMYCQIPVIAYDVGGIPEVVKSGETGWLVPGGDSAAFAQTILECLSLQDEARKIITDNAKKLVEEKYQIGKIAEEFEGLYRELLNS